jgi:hypothetical protein
VREENVRIFEKALAHVNAALSTEWAKAEATQQEYLDKLHAHTNSSKQVLDLDRMMGERKEELY